MCTSTSKSRACRHENQVSETEQREIAETLFERGQTREVYSLTPKGKEVLFQRLNEFSVKDAASEGAFRMRVGMFFALDADARARILQARDEFLEQREKKFVNLSSAMQLGKWGDEVTAFLLAQVRAERKWIAKLKKKK